MEQTLYLRVTAETSSAPTPTSNAEDWVACREEGKGDVQRIALVSAQIGFEATMLV